MSAFREMFFQEAETRFHLDRLKGKAEDPCLTDLGLRYAETFWDSPEVAEKYTLPETRLAQTALHCYHGGVIVALYEITEEDFKPSEKTFAVLTNMDTVFFSGLMFSRWNVKNRCVNYKTDHMAECLLKTVKYVLDRVGASLEDEEVLKEAMAMIFLCGTATDPASLKDPYTDLSGIE